MKGKRAVALASLRLIFLSSIFLFVYKLGSEVISFSLKRPVLQEPWIRKIRLFNKEKGNV